MSDVVFPRTPDGRRSSAALGRSVVADALRVVDPGAAEAAEWESDWRRGYLRHFRSLMTSALAAGPVSGPSAAGPSSATGPSPAARPSSAAGASSAGDPGPLSEAFPDPGYAVAAAGLASVRDRMRVVRGGGEAGLTEAFGAAVDRPLETVTITGSGRAERELILPYRGDLLRGDALTRRLDAWLDAGTIEPSCAEAIREVAANPDWLDLSDQRLVVLGAGAEMGPLPAVLGWGGTVIGVDLPRPELWARVNATASASAGRLIAPRDGADLLTDLPAVADWLLRIEGRLVLGNYVYAPGADYVRVSAAVDALATHVRDRRPDTALAFLATPTDVFAVPGAAVDQANARYRARGVRSRLAAAMSGGRLLRPHYPEGADPGIADSLVAQQGPNYALAKRIQRWRASLARRDGVVSFAVAPPTRTRSVLSNRLLAAAYAGAHLFDVEVFEPATANKLMAVLLVHQIRKPRPAAKTAWEDEAVAATHGGLWRTAYEPRTALGLAAVRGLPGAFRT